MAIVDDKELVV